MPELLTKYPEIVLKILKDSGISCGKKPAKLLPHCPMDRSCSLPTGELCIYDLTTAHQMTQMTPTELSMHASGSPPILSPLGAMVMIFIFGIGLWIGSKMHK